MAWRLPTCRPTRHQGFTYVGLLIFLAILALTVTMSIGTGTALQRGEREDELLFIGTQLQAAFRSYYAATPQGKPFYPATLDDLVRDTRGSKMLRHLRKVYVDPLTGKDWGLQMAPEGGIIAVFSTAEGTPTKTGGFPSELSYLEGTKKYSDWVFSGN
jgi:type II secretory pathway pseudopilin PulG